MDSTAQTAPAASEIFIETASTGDTCIRQRKQPLWALKSSTKTQSLQNQKSSTKLLPRVIHGLDIAKTHVATEIINESASKGDVWIRQSKQPCGLRKIHRNCFHW
jgi:hypothetical protein